ncbi:hypothetical protein D3C71_1451290 [compost metagenome]
MEGGAFAGYGNLRGAHVRFAVDAVGNRLRRSLCREIDARFIVSIQHGVFALFLAGREGIAESREEQPLGGAVLLHRMMVIQVVLG